MRGFHEVGNPHRPPRHHVYPQQLRQWFEVRGLPDIDDFTVELDRGAHEGIHGRGNIRMGRAWQGEWNRQMANRLCRAEIANRAPDLGNLTRDEILEIGEQMRAAYLIDDLPLIPFKDC